MVVLTDGMENVHPYVAELPAGTVTNRTYAIGFGLPGDISTAVLQQITSNTHGDLIITGSIWTAEQSFNLTKYFVQVLAGVTNMNVLLDPQGSLFFGSKHVIPFDLTEADVYADVIALCPIPQLLDFTLETPSGKIIKQSGGPNIKYVVGPHVAFYRITLPALPADPTGSYAGKWKAILVLRDKAAIDKLLRNREVAAALTNNPIGESLPYSLVAHAYSNLQFDASLQQDSLKPGTRVTLQASLKQYGVPFTGDAAVWAEVTRPDLITMNLKLDRVADGLYSATFPAPMPGVYPCCVRAEGYFNSRDKFAREKTLTAATYYGNYSTTPPGNGALCDLLHCLTSQTVLTKHEVEKLRDLGIDIEALRKCLEEHCPKPQEHPPPKPAKPKGQRPAPVEPRIKTERPARRIPLPKVKPVKITAPAQQFPRIVHMFSPESAAERAMEMPAKPALQRAADFPRIVRRFSRTDGDMPEPKEPVRPKRMVRRPKRG
jgi:hypothetical protein